jgi:hypothetical protein
VPDNVIQWKMRRYTGRVLWFCALLSALVGLYWGLGTLLHAGAGEKESRRNFRVLTSAPAEARSLPVLQVMQGDMVTLLMSADKPGLIHVDGYEKTVWLRQEGESSLTFLANQAGRFNVHMHDTDSTMHDLAVIEVQPR